MKSLKFAVWNMEWMNKLFVADSKPPAFKSNKSIQERIKDLSGVINEIDVDIIVIVEGPSRTEELQLFFDSDFINGNWDTYIQKSKGSQRIGLAVRIDKNQFKSNPFKAFDTTKNNVFKDFEVDTDGDKIEECHKFERKPLYVEIYPRVMRKFRILGLHLKSKGIFNAYEWSKWWKLAEGNRKKILAQASRIRYDFIDKYLVDEMTKNIPLIICGDINDSPGLDASEKKIFGSAIERLMVNIWKPDLSLGNALFDSLDNRGKKKLDFSKVATTRFKDPIFNDTWHKVWIDHLLYTKNTQKLWVRNAQVKKIMKSGKKIWEEYKHSSDHYPIIAEISTGSLK